MKMVQEDNNEDQTKKSQTDQPVDPTTPPLPEPGNEIDPDELVHSEINRDEEPADSQNADPDELSHTFPPPPDLSGETDIDDLMHPPAIDANQEDI